LLLTPSGVLPIPQRTSKLLSLDATELIKDSLKISTLQSSNHLPPPLDPEQRQFMSAALLQRPFVATYYFATGVTLFPKVTAMTGATAAELTGYTDSGNALMVADYAGRIMSQRAYDARRVLAGLHRDAGVRIDAFYVEKLKMLPPDSPERAGYLNEYAEIQLCKAKVSGTDSKEHATQKGEIKGKIEKTELALQAEAALDKLRRGESVDRAELEAIYKYYSQQEGKKGVPGVPKKRSLAGGAGEARSRMR
jgi:hypothetical protein